MKKVLMPLVAGLASLTIATPVLAETKIDLATTYSGANLHAETCREFAKRIKEAKLLSDIARPCYDKEATYLNQRILYTAPWPSSSIHTKRPINT